MRRRLLVTVVVLLAPLAFVRAEGSTTERTLQKPVEGVIELFTSQGCSSCPKADALFKSYAERTDIVALSFPVNYWDYLGWKDTLATPRNTRRQRAYARTRGDGAVYTPQIIINGRHRVADNTAGDIDATFEGARAAFAAARVPVRFWRDERDGMYVIEAGEAPAGSPAAEATIWLAAVRRSVKVPIAQGENRGKTITYHNVVRDLTALGTWRRKPVQIRLAGPVLLQPDAETCAILLQEGEGGPIYGAAWMGLSDGAWR